MVKCSTKKFKKILRFIEKYQKESCWFRNLNYLCAIYKTTYCER